MDWKKVRTRWLPIFSVLGFVVGLPRLVDGLREWAVWLRWVPMSEGVAYMVVGASGATLAILAWVGYDDWTRWLRSQWQRTSGVRGAVWGKVRKSMKHSPIVDVEFYIHSFFMTIWMAAIVGVTYFVLRLAGCA